MTLDDADVLNFQKNFEAGFKVLFSQIPNVNLYVWDDLDNDSTVIASPAIIVGFVKGATMQKLRIDKINGVTHRNFHIHQGLLQVAIITAKDGHQLNRVIQSQIRILLRSENFNIPNFPYKLEGLVLEEGVNETTNAEQNIDDAAMQLQFMFSEPEVS